MMRFRGLGGRTQGLRPMRLYIDKENRGLAPAVIKDFIC